ncbi:hypothetical protein [Robiginitomaculum antarcticum]|uniref:hypothetical protein n=1 Tax=Robiginitomaculum antarcticum TaxID=437507 RepID=UPI0012E9B4C0|nr:hypothetical protein [Robiginitomaculum antarcticum]
MRKKVRLKNIVPLMNVGLVSMPNVADGKMVANLVLDLQKYPSVLKYIQAHTPDMSGDANTQWFMSNKGAAYLLIEASKPAKVEFTIPFSMKSHALSADHIMRTRCAYLQGSNLLLGKSTNIDAPSILVEIPAQPLKSRWENHLHKYFEKRFRKRGFNKAEAKKFSKKHIEEFREFGSVRQK